MHNFFLFLKKYKLKNFLNLILNFIYDKFIFNIFLSLFL